MGVSDEHLGESGEDIGTPSGFTCPDCGGGLWESRDGELVRFRCRTGHAYSPESLVTVQTEALETALWAALRSLQEGASLNRRLAERMEEKGSHKTSTRFALQAEEAERHAAVLREILDRFPADVEAE